MRLYKILLHLYPSAFRIEYGEELSQVFLERRRKTGGAVSRIAFWVEEFLDIVRNAAYLHADMLKRDLRYTARAVSRSPGFALTAILVTALGIGANTAVFSIVNHALFRPLPFQDSDRLVRLWENVESYGHTELSPANYRDWQQRSASFERMAAFANVSMNLVGNGAPERVDGASVTAALVPMLGVRPVIGHVFSDTDDRSGAPGTVLLSYGLWQSRFAGSTGVLGQSVRLNEETFTVIGVMPASFCFPSRETRLWIPIRFGPTDFEDRGDTYLYGVAKLKSGVSIEQARAEMSVITKKLELEYPEVNAKTGATVDTMRDGVSRQSRLLLAALLGASLCVLLIACTNLANLFLVRAMGRRKELTVRAALGAGRERLIRQLFTESLAFAVVGAALGILLAHAALPLLSRLIPMSLPVGEATVLDVRVLAFAILLLGVIGIGFGVIPAMRICRGMDASGLHEGSRSGIGGKRERARSALVIAEVTASVILLISAGLLIRALWRIQAIDPGFKTEGVLTLQTYLPWTKYGSTARRVDFYSRVLEEVRVLPGVSNAAYISSLPMVGRGGIWGVEGAGIVPPDPGESQNASLRYITPGYFSTLRTPVLRGRDVNESDTSTSPLVAIVSESFVRRYWPEVKDPIGRSFHFANDDRAVVGVVGDIRVRGLETKSEPQVYLPSTQVPDNNIMGYVPKSLVIRSSSDVATLLPAVRSIIQKADPELPVSDVRTLQDILDGETAPRATQIRVLGAFAILSLLLAGIGIHGLLAFAVSQRIPEIGLRIAIGARSRDILAMVLSKGLQMAAIGGLIGMILAYAAGRAMEALLAGVKPADLITFLTASGLALFMTISGCLVPAWRAIRVDPARVMRLE